ncbi:hypothetical protein Zm00014a_007940 [Zea mays]|uniref:Secreted protein n=1 Tax=Zea mays TaxID=4577 RepID=A0A3L6FZJ9_MAIZE|nr:hypothetical protein Zm00014a_007940 [Zea mays]
MLEIFMLRKVQRLWMWLLPLLSRQARIGKIHTKGGNLPIIDWQRFYVLGELQIHSSAAGNSQSQPKEACAMNCRGTSTFHAKI